MAVTGYYSLLCTEGLGRVVVVVGGGGCAVCVYTGERALIWIRCWVNLVRFTAVGTQVPTGDAGDHFHILLCGGAAWVAEDHNKRCHSG